MKQKQFPIVGMRVPAPDMHDFPKGDKVVCIRIDSDLYRNLVEMAAVHYMKVATYLKRLAYDHVASQRLLSSKCNQRNQGVA